jgi:uncharacterized protein
MDFENLLLLSQVQLRIHNRPYQRAQFRGDLFKARMTVLLGPRGVGKTTAMIQHLLQVAGQDVLDPRILFVPSDHIGLKGLSLYEIGETFAHRGGTHVCFDEIHKVEEWSRELKSLYDTYPELTILASGSSALELAKGGVDLSRRAHVRHVHGLSFREFLELRYGLELGPLPLPDLLENNARHADAILDAIKPTNKRVLPLFQDYQRAGYLPFFLETSDESLYLALLEQNVHTILESDILAVNPAFTGSTIRKMEQLLSVVAASVPFKPDFNALRSLLDIGDQRTLKNYLRLMERAGLILSLSSSGKGLKTMEKPEKIYLGNPNLVHALARGKAEPGNLRETFFLSQTCVEHRVTAPRQGDFLVDDAWTFEVGGKNKTGSQVKGIAQAYLALDDMERGTGRRIPLWLLGFLY